MKRKKKPTKVAVERQATGSMFYIEADLEMTVNGICTIREIRVYKQLINGQWVDVPQRIFDVIVAYGGGVVAIGDLGSEAGLDPSGGHFSNSIGPLSTLGLIERRAGVVTPTKLLFPEGLV